MSQYDYTNVGLKIRELLVDLRVTLAEFAGELEVSEPQLSRAIHSVERMASLGQQEPELEKYAAAAARLWQKQKGKSEAEATLFEAEFKVELASASSEDERYQQRMQKFRGG